MSSLIKYSIYLLFAFVFLSCNSTDGWDCIKTRGDVITDFRSLDSFKRIYVYDKLDVELLQSESNAIEVIGGENLLPKITSEINGEDLIIRNENKCELIRNSDTRALVRIYFDSITNLEVFCSGFVRSIDTISVDQLFMSKRSNGDLFLTLNCNRVFIYSNEYGDAIFNGNIDRVSVRQEGVGLVDFSQCLANISNVETRGPGETRVNVQNKITGLVKGNGVLKVFGNPIERGINVIEDGQVLFLGP